MWTNKTLQETLKSKMADYQLIIASNRQPFHHLLKGGKLICQREPGGLVTAMDPVMQASGGTWVAAGGSQYDRQAVDSAGKVKLPPENPSYHLRRIFLTKEDRDAYYYGYSNEGLWPLCHLAYTRPVFLDADWQAYQRVNRMFADAILEEAGDQKVFVWVQDFHLALVAKYLKEANRSNIITSIFWHIPWPNAEIFKICPQRKEILEGLLAYDMVGFQILHHVQNFLATVDLELESRIDKERNVVSYQGHETLVRNFPISVDFDDISRKALKPEIKNRQEKLKQDFPIENKKLIVGVDRIDYTKGLVDKLRAVDRFLEKYPEWKEKFVFFQIGQISRIHIEAYKALNDEINALVERINWKHSQGDWAPIILTRAYIPYDDILALLAMADVCAVSSLHDGMNLVAKEYVSCRPDFDGVLLLSSFTGAAREFTDAVLINPYDPEGFADAIAQALNMPKEEREKRMRKMRELTGQQNIYRWAGKVLSQLLKFEFQEA